MKGYAASTLGHPSVNGRPGWCSGWPITRSVAMGGSPKLSLELTLVALCLRALERGRCRQAAKRGARRWGSFFALQLRQGMAPVLFLHPKGSSNGGGVFSSSASGRAGSVRVGEGWRWVGASRRGKKVAGVIEVQLIGAPR
jgi:hypothetical protein